jgi:hypothetical protein
MAIISLAVAMGGCSPGSPTPGDHGHEHGELPYEWSAECELRPGRYTLVFSEARHDPSILVAFLGGTGEREGMDHLAQHVMEAAAEDVPAGGSLLVKDQHAYNLELDPEGATFTLEVLEAGRYVIYTEHFAWEFDMRILADDGTKVEMENPREHAEPHEH